MTKIVIFEEEQEPITIETERYVLSYDGKSVVTNYGRDALVTCLSKLTFLAFMESLNEEVSDDITIPPQ